MQVPRILRGSVRVATATATRVVGMKRAKEERRIACGRRFGICFTKIEDAENERVSRLPLLRLCFYHPRTSNSPPGPSSSAAGQTAVHPNSNAPTSGTRRPQDRDAPRSTVTGPYTLAGRVACTRLRGGVRWAVSISRIIRR